MTSANEVWREAQERADAESVGRATERARDAVQRELDEKDK